MTSPPPSGPELRCPRCAGAFEPGLVLDHSYGYKVQAQWRAGEPTSSFWLGQRLGHGDPLPITTYRCAACGFLESYAPAPSPS